MSPVRIGAMSAPNPFESLPRMRRIDSDCTGIRRRRSLPFSSSFHSVFHSFWADSLMTPLLFAPKVVPSCHDCQPDSCSTHCCHPSDAVAITVVNIIATTFTLHHRYLLLSPIPPDLSHCNLFPISSYLLFTVDVYVHYSFSSPSTSSTFRSLTSSSILLIPSDCLFSLFLVSIHSRKKLLVASENVTVGGRDTMSLCKEEFQPQMLLQKPDQ